MTFTRATGHDIYNGNWSPILGERLTCEREPDNQHDQLDIYHVMFRKHAFFH